MRSAVKSISIAYQITFPRSLQRFSIFR